MAAWSEARATDILQGHEARKGGSADGAIVG